jgi:AcrR family transcriptional regulator
MAAKRELPTPRSEGMENIVAATIRLLGERGPADITLRDVARESGHGHRLIVEWFGGKGGLFDAVFRKIFDDLMQTGTLFYADVPLRIEVRRAFELFNYMHVHHRDFIESTRDEFVIKAMRERMQSGLGLAEDKATLVANRLSILVLGIALFRDYFSLSDDEVVRMMQDEFRVSSGFELADNPNRKKN